MHDARLLAKVLYGKAKSKEQVTGSKGEKNKMQGTYIQKAGVTGRQFWAQNPEPIKFALCLKTALPIFSKSCLSIA